MKKRQEYLRKKARAILGIIWSVGTILSVAVLCLLAVVGPVSGYLTLSTLFGLVLAVAICGYEAKMGVKKLKALPYIPPVAEQIAALPAEAILVRGSDQPAATSGELLRAAGQASETEPEELLRSMEGRTA